MDEQCVLCGGGAAVRVSGTSFCASCGLQQYSGGQAGVPKQRRSRRAAALGFLSSGFLLKMLLGAVALAAVGGVAASTAPQRMDPDPTSTTVLAAAASTSSPEVTTAASTSSPEVAVTVPDTLEFPEVDSATSVNAHEFAAAIQDWADCVSAAASAHSGGRFDPHAACPDKPLPSDFDLPAAPSQDKDDDPGNSGDAPGQDKDDDPGNSGDAPGQDKDDDPGKSGDAPGHDDDGPGNSENAPGQVKPPKDDKDKDE